jgi:multidrug resistance efflux pump
MEQARRNAGENSNILNGILEELHSAELKLTNNSLNYERQKKLWDNGIGSKVNLESKRLAYLSTSNQVDMIKSRLERTRYDLITQLNQAVNLFQSAILNSSDFNVVSRIDGKVYTISKNQGEIVSPQMPLASIGSARAFILEMLIDEVDITKVEFGQKILLTLDAYGKEVFEARVNKIYPVKDMRTQTFLVEGTFDRMPNKLYPGLTGEANIVIRTKENATVVLNQFVSEKSQVNTDDGMVDVVQGIKSLEYTEIISGVNTSTQILPVDQ